MDDRITNRVFAELDNHSKRLEALAEIVHTNAATLSLVTKLVVGVIIVLFGAGATSVYTMINPNVPGYHKVDRTTVGIREAQ